MQNFFEVTPENVLRQLLKSKKKSEIQNGFCDIGFSFKLFNEINDISFVVSFNVGASNKYINNVCYIDVVGEELNKSVQTEIKNLIIKVFKPEIMKFQ